MNRGELHRLRTGSPAHCSRPSGPDSTFLPNRWRLRLKSKCRILTQVHPVLFHIGVILIPSYGAVAAVGVLLALFLAQRTARIAGLNTGQVWNLCILSLFAALLTQRLLLVAVNWSDLRRHPAWMLALAMIHHPLLAAAGSTGWRGDRTLLCALEAAAAGHDGRCAGRAAGPGVGL
jgi:hypothetical protein